MPNSSPDLAAIEAAIQDVSAVRNISALHALERPDGALVIVTRVGLSPDLRLTQVVHAISDVEIAVRRAAEQVSAIFVEPDIAADAATPTETIVIRALE